MKVLAATLAALSLLGIDYPAGSHGLGRISLYDPVTLRPHGRSALVHGYVWGWDRSPSGSAVALGTSAKGRIQILATQPVAFSRILETGARGPMQAMRWVEGNRLLAVAGDSPVRALEIDLGSGRVAAMHPLGGGPVAIARTADGLAALVVPEEGVGPARLAVLAAGEPPRWIELGFDAGFPKRTGNDVDPTAPPELVPGLAVDAAAGVAYVAPPGPPRILAVDLAAGTVQAHDLGAGAAKGGPQRWRSLALAGPGHLVLGGYDADFREVLTPVGVRLVDVTTWTAAVLDPEAAYADASPDGVVIPRFHVRRGQKRQVLVFSPAGRRLAAFRPRFGLSSSQATGRYAYVTNGARAGRNHRTYVVDVRTGRVARILPFSSLPFLLAAP
jgi:hypothetical protein